MIRTKAVSSCGLVISVTFVGGTARCLLFAGGRGVLSLVDSTSEVALEGVLRGCAALMEVADQV